MSKTAIVTGASKGIGREIAMALARQNHRVLAVARTEQLLQELQQNQPDYIDFLAVDLTNTDEIQNLANHLDEQNSSVDILVNNAGALINKTFMDLSKEDWQYMLQVNLMSVIELTKALVPKMDTGAHIVNISSMGGFQGSSKFPGLTAYSVAKGGVSILSECLAAELADDNITVNALCLGSVQTEMFNNAFPNFEADVSPEDMGTYIADFALNGSTFYNGKVLPVALSNPS